ncbi:GH-E family nuclease [Lysinibacillus telephonicus]|uniref:GH-E family nuclease n=1 Tax=Lysinibacillus telephonicus TaxID=1714840 RepID=UPI0031FC7549
MTYGYDEFRNLVWSNQGGQFDFLYRSVDDVGNLYETREKTDRVYGAGSRLLETKDAKFPYDEEGNLVEKVETNGDTWKYEYYGNGMMSRVIKPDKLEVTFKYDTLGRRIEKSSDEKIKRFVWDGNTILHEFDSQNDPAEPNLVTWVFNDGFVPSAKITSEGHYSIISDYLGTPVEAYDDEGNRIWSAEIDVYGRVKEFTGEKDFIPFRYQGQYEDVEIGLYYNRFRYYDPEQGNYTQIDPIGLAGNNPTLYGYVSDPLFEVDVFGLLRRPYIRKSTRMAIEKKAKIKNGRFLDSNEGTPIPGGRRRSYSIADGLYDIGHKPGHEHWREVAKAEAEGLTQKEFNDRMNNPDLYHIEDPVLNQSHKNEDKSGKPCRGGKKRR